jgi:anti-anti-sigma factor
VPEDQELLRIAQVEPGVFLLSGEFDISLVSRFEGSVAAFVERGSTVVLDLEGLRFLDCGGAHAIAELARTVGDGTVVVRGAHGTVRRLLGLVEIDELRNVRSDVDGPGTGIDEPR